MKTNKSTIVLLVLAALFSTTAMAKEDQGSQPIDVVSKNANNNTTGSASFNSMDSHSVVTGSDLSRAVGMATAPALTTTLTETCMGSTSAGAGFSGGSFSFGTTWRDTECVNRLNAREIRTYGDVQASKEIMCSNDTVRQAFKNVGRPCFVDGGVYTVATPVAPVAAAAPVVATDKPAGDETDSIAKRTEMMLKQADDAAASLKAKGL
jgi:hypothetical protein